MKQEPKRTAPELCRADFEQILRNSLVQNGIPEPSQAETERFYLLTSHLITVNQTTNLTAIRTIPGIVSKHYADSLLLLSYLPQDARILDLGCGAGFPSLPLAILRSDLHIVALDSTDKKVRFVQECADLLSLSNLQTCSGRAEDSKTRSLLGGFDFVVSRAVARLNILAELALPYLKIGGALLAMKGARAEEEAEEALSAASVLGGSVPELIPQVLITEEGAEETRAILKIEKKKPTPNQYSRSYAAILKHPL